MAPGNSFKSKSTASSQATILFDDFQNYISKSLLHLRGASESIHADFLSEKFYMDVITIHSLTSM